MILEVIATCVDDAVTAEKYGVDRLELITAITEGGLTPGIGMVQEVLKAVSVPVHVMVRPHSRSFVYTKHDIDTMTAEIKAIRNAGAAGVVLGALTPDGRVDEPSLAFMLEAAGDMQVTFHRAFDELEDQFEGLNTLKRYRQITRILTSGGPKPAPESVPRIRELVARAKGSQLCILAGSGLHHDMIREFIQLTGVDEVHFGSAVRYHKSGLQAIDPVSLADLAARIKA